MQRLALRAVLGFVVFAAAMFVNRRAEAAFINVFDGCLEGSTNLVDCNGDRAGTADGDLTTTTAWNDTYLKWTVDFDDDTDLWRYTYSFFDATAGAQNLSHSIIELSLTFTEDNLFRGTECSKAAIALYTPLDSSNPGLPGPIYGVKCEGTQDNPSVVVLVTDRAPIWGDWYAKDGNEPNPPPDDVFGHNAGFLLLDPLVPASDGSVFDHILGPDTNPVLDTPEPVSLALFGLGFAAIARKRLLKR